MWFSFVLRFLLAGQALCAPRARCVSAWLTLYAKALVVSWLFLLALRGFITFLFR